VALTKDGDAVRVSAWGPGAERTVDRTPEILGSGDELTGFDAGAHPVMLAAFAGHAPGWRMLRTERVLEALVPAILEQRVTGLESRRSWRTLLRSVGEPAPGPAPQGMRVPPTAAQWARVPSWQWHRAGVDPGRARTIVAAVGRAATLERLSERRPAEARVALTGLPGIGVWTAAEVAMRAWGDADAVPYGDFHLARDVVWALTGRFDGTDEQLAEVLIPWAGQRGRAARLIRMQAGLRPRRGPRAAITDHRSW
jgi:3-methyladenine DNA glycosylase/8-oxoguanine DNA glycosylase